MSPTVDAIWTPIVETMSANVNGITAGTVPTGQQMSAMLVATISTPANMGMCASTECKRKGERNGIASK